MILFITNKDDITTDLIINKVNKEGKKYYRFNTEDLGSNIFIKLDFTKERYYIIDEKKEIETDLNKVKSVYYRRPKLPNIDHLKLSPGLAAFVNNEHYYFLEGLYKLLRKKYWISPVYSIREAENKIYQIFLARELGFKVPESLITSNPAAAKAFLDKHSDSVVKPIKSGFVNDRSEPKIIFTSKVTDKEKAQLNKIAYCPTYFQENIKKAYDLRVTIVGDKIFPAKIESQSFKETIIDWRRGENIFLRYEKHKLPQYIREKCLAMTKYLKLEFSAIDLVVDRKGDFIFLEINPNGQWAWIEKRLGYNISGEIIDLLKRGGNESTKKS